MSTARDLLETQRLVARAKDLIALEQGRQSIAREMIAIRADWSLAEAEPKRQAIRRLESVEQYLNAAIDAVLAMEQAP
jgi:hypothetical protein